MKFVYRCTVDLYMINKEIPSRQIIQGDPEEYISLIDGIEREKNLKKCAEENPEEFDEEEIKSMDENIAYMENELKDMRTGWEPDYEPDMEWEIIKVRSWVEEKRKLG